MRWFQSWVDWLRSLFFKREMDLALIGLQNAGKSSLVNVLTTGQFHADMIPTVRVSIMELAAWQWGRPATGGLPVAPAIGNREGRGGLRSDDDHSQIHNHHRAARCLRGISYVCMHLYISTCMHACTHGHI